MGGYIALASAAFAALAPVVESTTIARAVLAAPMTVLPCSWRQVVHGWVGPAPMVQDGA